LTRRRALVLPLLLVLVFLFAVAVVMGTRDGNDPSTSRPEASADICDADETVASAVGLRLDSASALVEPTPALEGEDVQLAWSDEFEGDEVDAHMWSNRECWHNSPGFVNDSEAWLPFPATSENLLQADGVVRLQARRDQEATDRGHVMTTAMLTTRERYDTFTHGVVEARMKIPTGRGLWPAFWLMGNGTDDEGWPQTGEIDIFEFVNNGSGGTGRMYSSVHWGDIVDGAVASHQSTGKSVEVPWWGDNEFHTFTLHRTSDFLCFYVDGEQVIKLLPGEPVDGYPMPVPDGGALFEDPMHIRLSLEVGGPWAGQAHEPATYEPGELVIDYVRAWQ